MRQAMEKSIPCNCFYNGLFTYILLSGDYSWSRRIVALLLCKAWTTDHGQPTTDVSRLQRWIGWPAFAHPAKPS